VKEPVVVKPTEPVPSNNKELEAVADRDPLIVMFPMKVVLPDTVRDPDMTGEYSFMLCYSYAGF
jgi:hypothetical protein